MPSLAPPFTADHCRPSCLIGWRALRCLLLATLAVPAPAAERELAFSAPPSGAAGSDVKVSVEAATHLGGGEQIGFFHGEYSVDGGRTWTGFCYEQNQGTEMKRTVTVKAGPPGSRIIVRVRVAFRDGAAGDVDYSGAAIRWTDTWENWRQPPAKSVTVAVVAN